MKLEAEEVAFHPFSYGDWSGRVFSWEGGFYRAISGERAPFYERLLSEGILRDLMRRQLLVDTEIADLELDGYALALKHRTVPFVSHCYEWCGEMLKAAALLVLEIERELLKYGLTLQDAHPYNVLFDGPTPVWVDLGSLVPVSHGEPWQAYEEFLAYFTRPLKIMAAGRGDIARCLLRCLLRDGDAGIQQRDVEAITGTAFTGMIRAAKTKAKAVAREAVPSMLRPFASRAIRSRRRSQPFRGTKETINSIDNAIREIENIRLVQPRTISSNCNGADFPDLVATTGWTKKHRSVADILSAKKPESVLDIGSSHGWYSQLAARNGAQVVSVDFDEASVTKLFFDAVTGRLPILPLVTDFRSMNPMMAWAAAPGGAYVDRLRCDMVLALGLVHHLIFEQRLNFDLIARGLSAFARKCLAVEFIGREDPYVRERLDGRFSWYNLENFSTALGREFREVKKFPSDKEYRWVLLCER
jgi:SAM-dependent methyltransferase